MSAGHAFSGGPAKPCKCSGFSNGGPLLPNLEVVDKVHTNYMDPCCEFLISDLCSADLEVVGGQGHDPRRHQAGQVGAAVALGLRGERSNLGIVRRHYHQVKKRKRRSASRVKRSFTSRIQIHEQNSKRPRGQPPPRPRPAQRPCRPGSPRLASVAGSSWRSSSWDAPC